MEEFVGKRWHKFVTNMARPQNSSSAVRLEDEQARLGIVFRAFGGDPGLNVEPSIPRALQVHKRLIDRIAGTGRRHDLSWRDEQAVRVPSQFSLFTDASLNRDLYLWLMALASRAEPNMNDWFGGNQQLVLRVLAELPGLEKVYRRLALAINALRPDPERLKGCGAARERAIQAAIVSPGSHPSLPPCSGDPFPVALWLYPQPGVELNSMQLEQEMALPESTLDHSEQDKQRHQGEYVDDVSGRSGLIVFRLDSLFSWSEFVPVDRTVEDGKDDDAGRIAADLDKLSLTRTGKAPAARIKLDVDLGAKEILGRFSEGQLLPEWDWRSGKLNPGYCRIVPQWPVTAVPCALPSHLTRDAARLRRDFSSLKLDRLWQKRRAQGSGLDLQACIEYQVNRQRGTATNAPDLWQVLSRQHRDLGCLILADLSLSTETWVDDENQVIDVIRDGLHLLGESLNACGDRFGMYGFSSRTRSEINFTTIKSFTERWGDEIHGRIQDVKPGYYTRMGAAIRQATMILADQPTHHKLLLLITDGKPNDLDLYEGRYGVEDTRHAIQAARKLGITLFCLTVEQEDAGYLPYLFGRQNYILLRQIKRLPLLLPRLYLRLTEQEGGA